MVSTSVTQNDESVQEAARNLFCGVAPERTAELEMLWKTYRPRFNLLLDDGPDGRFVMDAGAYRDVRFNHRSLRAFWLAAFIAWEGYRAFAESTGPAEDTDLSKFEAMVRDFHSMIAADESAQSPLPPGVPEPGVFPDRSVDPHTAAAADLATIAVGWALLHEVRHLQHQQLGTAASIDASAKERHAEELSCDAFATSFVLDKAGDYAAQKNVPADKVRMKRELGVYFALFAMTLISADAWGSSESHPALQTRIDHAMCGMGINGTRISDAMAHVAFAALWRRSPNAPGPFKRQV